jgi:hypothetical protein
MAPAATSNDRLMPLPRFSRMATAALDALHALTSVGADVARSERAYTSHAVIRPPIKEQRCARYLLHSPCPHL